MKVTPENAHHLIPDNFRLRVRHYHEGNDPQAVMRKSRNKIYPYVTVAEIHKAGTEPAIIYGRGTAVCSPKDSPDRRVGWQIAAGRAFKDFLYCWYS